jgi:Fe-S-cluster containining protein
MALMKKKKKKADEVPPNLIKLVSALKSGEIQYVKPTDTFKFKCAACGECCINKDVLLNPYDIWELFETGVAQSLGFTSTEALFVGESAPFLLTLGMNSGAPVAMIAFRPLTEAGTPTICPFLVPVTATPEEMLELETHQKTGTAQEATNCLRRLCSSATKPSNHMVCALHRAKPSICRAYPIGRAGEALNPGKTGKPADLTMSFVKVPVTCGTDDQEWTVQEWVDSWGLTERYKHSDAYFSLVTKIALKKDSIPEEVRWLITNVIFNFDSWGGRSDSTFEDVMAAGNLLLEEFLVKTAEIAEEASGPPKVCPPTQENE